MTRSRPTTTMGGSVPDHHHHQHDGEVDGGQLQHGGEHVETVMPGFRFHPTEEELIEFYLRRKVEGKRFNVELITFLDLYRYDPWELPGLEQSLYSIASFQNSDLCAEFLMRGCG